MLVALASRTRIYLNMRGKSAPRCTHSRWVYLNIRAIMHNHYLVHAQYASQQVAAATAARLRTLGVRCNCVAIIHDDATTQTQDESTLYISSMMMMGIGTNIPVLR